jgi:hypothetical protein
MRITGLLILLLFLVICFAAPAASYAQSSSSSAAKSVANADGSMTVDRALLREFARRDGLQIERDGVCFTMRTYVMAREDKDSDVTYPVRVTRCMPDSRLEFKSAVAPERREKQAPGLEP